MINLKQIFVLLIGSLLIISGCGKHRVKPKKNYNGVHLHQQNTLTSRPYYTRPTFQQAGQYGGFRGGSRGHVPIARDLESLDQISANTQPYYVYSYPATTKQNSNLVSSIKYRVLNYINSIRARGAKCAPPAPPLGWSDKLEQAALSHAIDMRNNNFLSHLGSGTEYDVARKAPGVGSNFYERILYFGYPIQPNELAGEILSYTKYRIVGSKDPEKGFKHAVDNFLRSPKHCRILMNPRFRDTGIAAYRDNEKIYWVIEFAEVSY